MEASCSHQYVLGLDLGTSTVKGILIEGEGGEVSEEASRSLSREGVVAPAGVPGAQERRVEEIWTCLEVVLGALDASKLQRVCAIGICGQMHGCVLWKDEIIPELLKKRSLSSSSAAESVSSTCCSNLITWQDGRCSQDFLASLPATQQRTAVSAGYGCATLAWLRHYQPEVIRHFTRAGTIMDLVSWVLCSFRRDEGGTESQPGPVVMSSQNAVSWGYFDTKEMQWELDV